MKNKGLALGSALAVALICTASYAGNLNPSDGSTDPAATGQKSDPVSELRNQDGAFSILIEAYRQLQSHLIQADYEARVGAAARLTDLKVRRQVTVLARQERDLRLQKLYGQLTTMSTAYDYTRQRDEREAGIDEPSHVDTAAAAEKLKDFVVLTPAGDSRADIGSVKTMPATTVLLDTRPSP
jgi:hypothetical protein